MQQNESNDPSTPTSINQVQPTPTNQRLNFRSENPIETQLFLLDDDDDVHK